MPSRAGIVAAAKASDLQMQAHGAALPGQIGQAPAVAALPPRRRLVAQRAAGRGAGRVGLDDDGVAGREQAVDGHADRQETEHGLGQQALGSGEDGPRGYGGCGRNHHRLCSGSEGEPIFTGRCSLALGGSRPAQPLAGLILRSGKAPRGRCQAVAEARFVRPRPRNVGRRRLGMLASHPAHAGHVEGASSPRTSPPWACSHPAQAGDVEGRTRVLWRSPAALLIPHLRVTLKVCSP
jgi:hypothetical protein